ncbi:hypothetical protein NC653_030320 [Populus alba x Populus x berolinensis]|uniref:Uncharacterized protein n=1 Tax=Populus alba x Populus x berolinensis TaxID=444605 RepID=A0AAD6Q1Y0_9ROSI|nr:hypothetical protein NC653_030320 [Populus alba x Populus x berolinensis]
MYHSIRMERSTKSNAVIDGNMNMAMDNRKNGMDVVSFMFSSPIKIAMPIYQSSGQMSDKCNNSAIDSFGSNDHPSFRSSTSYLPGLNVVGDKQPSSSITGPECFKLLHDKDKYQTSLWLLLISVLVEKSQLAMKPKVAEQDMTTKNVKWLDFSIEAFEDGVEI